MKQERTQVGIVGAGPSGLLLSHLLHQRGIESVVLEKRTRAYVEGRVRAGQLQHSTVDTLRQAGVAARLDREGLVHEGFELRFGGRAHRIPLAELTGRRVTMYGQQEIVKDLIASRLDVGGRLQFGVDDIRISGVDGDTPALHCTLGGERTRLRCDFVAGCDGFHGVSRQSIPSGRLTVYRYDYPFAWLGILARVPPSTREVMYAVHDRGFALHSMRSRAVSRLYLQVGSGACLSDWPERRVWPELRLRLALDDLAEGPVLDMGITAMRGFVAEPMRYGRLFLVGDAAHIVPPSAALGLNLAMADTAALADALTSWYRDRDPEPLDRYSAQALRRAWQGQEFSALMTTLLHRFDHHERFEQQLQRARLERLVGSPSAAREFAERYVNTPRA